MGEVCVKVCASMWGGREGRRGGYSATFYSGSLSPGKTIPLSTLSYTIFDTERYSFRLPSVKKWYTAKSKKVALVIGHLGILNDAMIYLSDHQTIASQCPKQPLLNELYKGFGTRGWTSPEKKLRSVSIFIYTWMERDKVEGDSFEKKYPGWAWIQTQRSQVLSLPLGSLTSTLYSIINKKKKKKTPRSVVNFHDSFHILKLEPPITAVYLMAAKESAATVAIVCMVTL